jgi:KTSC domain
MSWTKNVFSTMVQEIGYDSDKEEMTVVWNNGRQSAYSGVPEDVALDVAHAASVGAAMNSMIKGQYGHRYI